MNLVHFISGNVMYVPARYPEARLPHKHFGIGTASVSPETPLSFSRRKPNGNPKSKSLQASWE